LFRVIGAGGFLPCVLATIARAVTAGMKLFAFALDDLAGNNECPKRIHYGLFCRDGSLSRGKLKMKTLAQRSSRSNFIALWMGFFIAWSGTAFGFALNDRVQVFNGPVCVHSAPAGSTCPNTQATGAQGLDAHGNEPTSAHENEPSKCELLCCESPLMVVTLGAVPVSPWDRWAGILGEAGNSNIALQVTAGRASLLLALI
jgi:hypothetical protein